MSITKHNRTNNVTWKVNNDGFDYIKLRELSEGEEYPLLGCFISKDHGYGEGAVLITQGYNVNIPQKYVETVQDIMNDPEAIDEINSGRTTFSYVTFTSKKYRRDGYTITFTVK